MRAGGIKKLSLRELEGSIKADDRKKMGHECKVWLVFLLLGAVGLWHQVDLRAQGRLVAEELERGSVSGQALVVISQPALLREAMRQDLLVNRAARRLNGFRVRVYRGLGRNARSKSIEISEKLKEHYPGLAIYRAYQAPYYLTSVGNCRTHIEALSLQHRLLGAYPQAFVIEANIDYPPLCAQRGGADGGLDGQKGEGEEHE